MRYDVLISYHTEEQAHAAELARTLRGFGLVVWFDRWNLRPGRSWLPELESALADSAAVVVLIGPSGPGPWQAVEVGSAVLRFANSGNPVIPVLLPPGDLPDIPPALRQHTPITYEPLSTPFVTLSQLVWAITGRRVNTSVGQVGEQFALAVPSSSQSHRLGRVFTLPNPNPGTLLHITWDTFGYGIVFLIEQIKSLGRRLDVDACLGVNEAGLVMATFLASNHFNRSPIGYLKFNKAHDGVTLSKDSLLPDLAPHPTVIICDFEVKYSDVVGFLAHELRDRYDTPDLYFVVFGAMTEDEDLVVPGFDRLTGNRILVDAGFCEIFIAATMNPPGIEPPLELR